MTFELRIGPGLAYLVTEAINHPGQPVKGTVGALMRLEVSAIVVQVGASDLVDLTLIVHLPLVVGGASAPPDWPGTELLIRLAELATSQDFASLELDYPTSAPPGGGLRPIDRATELPISVRNWVP